VVDHPWPQEVQQPRVAHLGTPGPCEAQQASSRPHGAETSEGLPVQAEEPQVARSPGEPLGWADKPPWW
jgi:hypothetical protein